MGGARFGAGERHRLTFQRLIDEPGVANPRTRTAQPMRILLTGATGFVGRRLCEIVHGRGDTAVALSRDAEIAKGKVPAIGAAYSWHPEREPAPVESLAGVDAVMHLAGETVVGRWTEAKRNAIRDSRVIGTRNLVAGIAKAETKPQIMVSASAIGFYGDRGDEELTEESTPGDDFLADTSIAWEEEARKVEALGVRLARVRIGVVLGPGGGALGAMLTPFKLGLGGPLGSGRQWWSWIHRDDLVGLILHLIDNDLSGTFNGTAPVPSRQKDFAKALGRVLHRPAFIPLPAFQLKILMGGFATELLSSKRVLPQTTLGTGYQFQHPELEVALRSVLGR